MIYSGIAIGYPAYVKKDVGVKKHGIGAALRSLREAEQGRTQGQLAKAAGTSQPTISDWERNAAIPDALWLTRLAVALECSIDALVVGLNPAYDQWRNDQLRHPGKDNRAEPGGATHAAKAEAARVRQKHDELRRELAKHGERILATLNHYPPENPAVQAGKRKSGRAG